MISVSCPGCGKSYKLDPALIGKKGRCKVCESSFVIEDPSDRDDEARSAVRRPASSVKPATTRTKPEKSKPAKSDPDDDAFGGLNSVSSDGEAVDELPELPARRTRTSTRRDDDDDDAPARPKKKRKPERSGAGLSLGGPLTSIIAASVGGGVGALIWGAIAYFAHVEVGYVAWGIGGLVGFCVRVAAGDMDDTFAGIIAAVGSVISILAGKLLSAYFIVQWVIQQGQLPGGLPPELQGQLVGIAFMHSFGPVDIIFFLLAIATAYKLGAGHSEE